MNILLSSVGRRNYLVKFFQEALRGRGKVLATDTNQYASAMADADVAVVVPPATSPDYVDTLLKICAEHRVGMLLTLNDLVLPVLARNRQRFLDLGVQVAVSTPKVVDICADKLATSKFLREQGIPAPLTFSSFEETKMALDREEVSFPLVIKARWGSGSLGLHIVDDYIELISVYRCTKREMKKSNFTDFFPGSRYQGLVVQPCISGKEYNLDVINNFKGEYQATLCKEKLGMRCGETDKAVTVQDAKLEKLGEKLGRALKHVGNLDCDVFRDQDGNDYVIDLNPRFGGGYPFSHVAGANVPATLLAWAEGETHRPEWLRVEPGVISSKCDRLVVSKERAGNGRLSRDIALVWGFAYWMQFCADCLCNSVA